MDDAEKKFTIYHILFISHIYIEWKKVFIHKKITPFMTPKFISWEADAIKVEIMFNTHVTSTLLDIVSLNNLSKLWIKEPFNDVPLKKLMVQKDERVSINPCK